MEVTEKSESEIKFEKVSRFLPVLATILVFVPLSVYFFNFNKGFGDQSTFGAFGDFLGGVLNPILSFLTIVLLIYSMRFQLEELKQTRRELSRTNEIHNDNLNFQSSIFKVTRLVTQLDVILERQKELLTHIACKGTTSIGPTQFKAFEEEGKDYKWVYANFEDVINDISEFKKFDNDLSKQTTKSILIQYFELYQSFKEISKCLEDSGAQISLYRLTSIAIKEHFNNINSFIDKCEVEDFRNYYLK